MQARGRRGLLVADSRPLVHSVIVHPKEPREGFDVRGKLAALVGGGLFRGPPQQWVIRGSGGGTRTVPHPIRAIVFKDLPGSHQLKWNVVLAIKHQVAGNPLGFMGVERFQNFRPRQPFMFVYVATKRTEAVCARKISKLSNSRN